MFPETLIVLLQQFNLAALVFTSLCSYHANCAEADITTLVQTYLLALCSSFQSTLLPLCLFGSNHAGALYLLIDSVVADLKAATLSYLTMLLRLAEDPASKEQLETAGAVAALKMAVAWPHVQVGSNQINCTERSLSRVALAHSATIQNIPKYAQMRR